MIFHLKIGLLYLYLYDNLVSGTNSPKMYTTYQMNRQALSLLQLYFYLNFKYKRSRSVKFSRFIPQRNANICWEVLMTELEKMQKPECD